MAKLFSDTLTRIFTLQRRLIELIDEAAATEFQLFEQFGETEATITELEELQNSRERLRDPYNQISTLLLRIAEYQPTAPNSMLNFLIETIEFSYRNHRTNTSVSRCLSSRYSRN